MPAALAGYRRIWERWWDRSHRKPQASLLLQKSAHRADYAQLMGQKSQFVLGLGKLMVSLVGTGVTLLFLIREMEKSWSGRKVCQIE